MPTLLEILNKTADYFKQKGVPSPKLDAELLIAHVLKIQRLQIYLQFERVLEPIILDKLRPLVKRRGEREPLQYITGEVEWGGLTLKVDRRCLVPRNETEELWDKIVQEYKTTGCKPKTILDLGTGSGALALALKKSFPEATVTAVDKSYEALTLALENAQALKLEVGFIEGNWCERVEGQFDLIVSNPPYLTDEEMKTVKPEVAQWEPKMALIAPDEGFSDIAEVIRQAKGYLRQGGEVWIETGIAHADRVRALAAGLGYARVAIYQDQARRDRFARLTV